MANRILVTGASGNIGRELVKQLQARGADFAVMTSKPGSTPSGVPSVQGDFTRPDTLPAAFASVDTLFLLFPLTPGMDAMARNAVAAAKAAGVRHIVRSSGAGADSASPGCGRGNLAQSCCSPAASRWANSCGVTWPPRST